MLKHTSKGLYCEQGDFYIDPVLPVDKAVVTHAHSDHARSGHQYYLAHKHSLPILRSRLGENIRAEGLEYGEMRNINGIKVSLHPSGHVIGAAQVRLEFKGEVWVVSGDYKLEDDGFVPVFEPVKCHHFITEATFGLPIYNWQPQAQVFSQIYSWWQGNAAQNRTSIISAYSLGKSQRLIFGLSKLRGNQAAEIYVHESIARMNVAIRSQGFELLEDNIPSLTIPSSQAKQSKYSQGLVLAPANADPTWLSLFGDYALAECSGWMQTRNFRKRASLDAGFVLSDHADWKDLNFAITATGAENIYTTHGFTSPLARWLKEEKGLNAVELGGKS